MGKKHQNKERWMELRLAFKDSLSFEVERHTRTTSSELEEDKILSSQMSINPFLPDPSIILLCLMPDYFTLSKARRFYSSTMGLWVGEG